MHSPRYLSVFIFYIWWHNPMNLVQGKPWTSYSLPLSPPQKEIMEFTVHILGVLGEHAAKQLEKRKTIPLDECFYFENGLKKLAHFHKILYRLPIQHTPCFTPRICHCYSKSYPIFIVLWHHLASDRMMTGKDEFGNIWTRPFWRHYHRICLE